MPQADWLVMTWTRDEHRALARVFTPINPSGDKTDFDKWYDYRRGFDSYAGDLRSSKFDPHPAIHANRLGRFQESQVLRSISDLLRIVGQMTENGIDNMC